jgi:hypothetical protein
MPNMTLYVAAPLLICLLVLLVVRSRRANRETDAPATASLASAVAPYGAPPPAPVAEPVPAHAVPPAPPTAGYAVAPPALPEYAAPAPAFQPPVAFDPAFTTPSPVDPYGAPVSVEQLLTAPVIPSQALPQPSELLSFGQPASEFSLVAEAMAPVAPEPAAVVEKPFPDPDFVVPPITILPGR